jgi:hypothetical protein
MAGAFRFACTSVLVPNASCLTYRPRQFFVTMTYFGPSQQAPHTCTAHAGLRVIVALLGEGAPSKKPRRWAGAFALGVLTMTYFHAVYPALSSARLRFTVLFGMGRRGPTVLWSSGILRVRRHGLEVNSRWARID